MTFYFEVTYWFKAEQFTETGTIQAASFHQAALALEFIYDEIVSMTLRPEPNFRNFSAKEIFSTTRIKEEIPLAV